MNDKHYQQEAERVFLDNAQPRSTHPGCGPWTGEDEVAVGDLDSSARGTGARKNANKPEIHQLPLWVLEDVARVLMYGAKKYKRANWAKGMPWTVPFDCAMRHLIAWQRGEDIDEESGLPHLALAMTNIMFLMAYRDLYPEGDDRITEFQPGGVKRNGPEHPDDL